MLSNYSLTNGCCSIDATTSHTDRLGRFVNDAKYGNSNIKKLFVNGRPHLCLFAVSDIQPGEQILYDYGDDAGHLFWRDKVCIVYCIDFYSSSTLFCIGHKSITVRRLCFFTRHYFSQFVALYIPSKFQHIWQCIKFAVRLLFSVATM